MAYVVIGIFLVPFLAAGNGDGNALFVAGLFVVD